MDIKESFLSMSKRLMIARKLLCSQQHPLRRNQMPEQPLFFTGWSGIEFFYSFLRLTQSVRQPLVPYPSLCSTFFTYRTSCRSIGHQVLPIQPLPREAEDFHRGRKYPRDVALLTYLATSDKKVIFGRFYL